MIPTHGLTHLNLVVRDLERSMRFYRDVFGCEEIRRETDDHETMVLLNTPGSHDVLTLWHEAGAKAGDMGSLRHFGFRLRDAGDIDRAA